MTQVLYRSSEPTGQASETAAIEDLIPEARQHHHRRLLRTATVALAGVALIAGLLIWTVGGGGQGGRLNISTRSPYFGATVAAATARAGSASVRILYQSSSVTKIGQQLLTSQLCRTAGTTAHGTIDFTSHSLTLNVISRTCSGSSTTKWAMEQREVKGTLFATLPRVSGGFRLPFPPTPPSRPWLAGASARLATGSMSGVGGVSSSLTTGFLPTVLHAIHGRVTKIGTRVIEGTIATGYRTTISLADLQQSSRKESRLSGASFENISSPKGSLPAATTIPFSWGFGSMLGAESVSFCSRSPSTSFAMRTARDLVGHRFIRLSISGDRGPRDRTRPTTLLYRYRSRTLAPHHLSRHRRRARLIRATHRMCDRAMFNFSGAAPFGLQVPPNVHSARSWNPKGAIAGGKLEGECFV